MRIHAVSDVHRRVEGLAEAGQGCDLFICLGDLVLFLDYDDPGEGIFPELFGEANARRYIDLRTERRFDEARDFSRELWEAIGADPWTSISQKVQEQYRALFAAMPPGLLTYGNVDIPRLWTGYLRPGHTVLDKEVIDVEGQRWGFLGGGHRVGHRGRCGGSPRCRLFARRLACLALRHPTSPLLAARDIRSACPWYWRNIATER